jgi:hypothetical protein
MSLQEQHVEASVDNEVFSNCNCTSLITLLFLLTLFQIQNKHFDIIIALSSAAAVLVISFVSFRCWRQHLNRNISAQVLNMREKHSIKSSPPPPPASPPDGQTLTRRRSGGKPSLPGQTSGSWDSWPVQSDDVPSTGSISGMA